MQRSIHLVKNRIVSGISVIVIVTIGTFFLLEAASGDAVDAYMASSGGGDAQLAADLRQQWGLEGSVLARLGFYLWNLLHLNFGYSVGFNRPILPLILERLPNTLLLMGTALALSFSLGSLLGIYAGSKPNSFRDKFLSSASLALYAIPSFWLSLVLVVIFSVQLRWLPLSGIETLASGKQGLDRAYDIVRHLVLPVGALGFLYLALYLRMMRAGMVEVWRQDYILAATAKGLPRHRIIWRHVVRNALLPLITMLGIQAAAMLGGSVVIESVFSIPGLGRLAQEAVAHRDTALLTGIIIFSATFVVIINILVDLLYSVLDPRVGKSGSV